MDPIVFALNYTAAQAALKDATSKENAVRPYDPGDYTPSDAEIEAVACNTDAATCEQRRAASYCIEDEERREREEYEAYVARKEAAQRYPVPANYPDPTGYFAACGNFNTED